MPKGALFVALGALLLSAAPVCAQDGKPGRQERMARLRAKLRDMSPEERAEFRRKIQELKQRSPEERAELRKKLREFKGRSAPERKRLRSLSRNLGNQRGDLAQRRRRLQQVPDQQRRKYKMFMRRLMKTMPAEERQALARLEPQERRQKMQALLRKHRESMTDRRIGKLPEGARRDAGRSLRGLRGKARSRQARQFIDGYVRRQAQSIWQDDSLSRDEKRRRMQELIRKHVPKDKRQAMQRRMQERMRNGRRPGTDRPRRPMDGRNRPRRPMDGRRRGARGDDEQGARRRRVPRR